MPISCDSHAPEIGSFSHGVLTRDVGQADQASRWCSEGGASRREPKDLVRPQGSRFQARAPKAEPAMRHTGGL